MPKYTCEYCQGEFSKLSNLDKHQRTAKYCAKLQEEKKELEARVTCEYCNKILSRSDSLLRHYTSCVEYLFHQRYQTEIDNLKDRLVEKDRQIEQLEKKLWDLTNTSVNKVTNSYTHIGQVNIGAQTAATGEPMVYPLTDEAPIEPEKVTNLIDELHKRVVGMFNGQKPLLLKD